MQSAGIFGVKIYKIFAFFVKSLARGRGQYKIKSWAMFLRQHFQ